MFFLFTKSIVSLVCEEPFFDSSKKQIVKIVRSHNATSSSNNKGSLHFIIPDEVLHKNSSFKRSILQLGNHFANKKCGGLCTKYFHLGNPPTLFVEGFWRSNIKHICQIYKNAERFASVFNTFYRIPVYSAYKLKTTKEMKNYVMEDDEKNDKEKAVVNSSTWKYEPQLELNQNDPQMREMVEIKNLKEKDVRKQATGSEYANSGWDKGHLFPNSYNVSLYHILVCLL